MRLLDVMDAGRGLKQNHEMRSYSSGEKGSLLLVLAGFALSTLVACSSDSDAIDTTSPGGGSGGVESVGGAGGGGQGGEPPSGGAGGLPGTGGIGDGGLGGQGAGAGGTGGVERPVAPEWVPPFPVGSPGWRDSTDSFCTERFGILGGPRVWSDAQAVYALVAAECNTLVACDGGGASLYANEGSGWQPIFRNDLGGRNGKLTAVPGGPLVVSDTGCGITFVERDGTASCSWENPDFEILGDVFATPSGKAYALVGEQRLLQFSAGTWSPLADVPVGLSGAIWADDTSILVAAFNQYVVRVDPSSGQVSPLPGVIAGDYTDVWAFGDDVWLSNRVGQLVHYDGATWSTIDTGLDQEILGLWGAPDGVLYFYATLGFGRYDGQVELFANPAELPDGVYFTSLWGNSATEVFLGVRDNGFRDYRCSGAFTVFFDGSELHLF